MNSKLWFGTIAVAYLMATGMSMAESSENINYLRLTRANLPSAKEIIAGCLANLDFDSESYDSYRKKERLSAWLPSVHVGAEVQEDRYTSFGYVEDVQVVNNGGGGVNTAQSYDGYTANGYDDAAFFEAWLQWDLRDFVYKVRRHLVIAAQKNQENERHFLYNEVSKRIAKLWVLLPEKKGDPIPEAKKARIIENAAILDALSGSMLSDAVRALDVEVEIISVNHKKPVEQEMSQDEEPALIEVDQGQDDTVEKAF
jgi:hypothetical protein